MRSLLPMLLLAALSQAAPAHQGPPPALPGAQLPPGAQATILVEPAAMALAGWDADTDGRTTRVELAAGLSRSFPPGAATMGYIDYADWARRWLGDANALPSPFDVDADHDNRITRAELQTRFARLFDRLDVDKDQAVTRAELVTIRATAFGTGGPPPPARDNGQRPRRR